MVEQMAVNLAGTRAAKLVQALVERGYAALSRSEVQTALSYFAQALARDPGRVDLLNDVGGIHGMLGRHVEAVDSFQRALMLAPERVDVLTNLGLSLGMLGRHEEAIEYLSSAVDLCPEHFDALCTLGYSLSQTGRHDEALFYLEQSVGINPAHVAAQCNLAIALAGLERHAAALEAFRQVLDLDARHVNALSGGAASLIALDRFDEAIAWLDRALAIDPSNAAALTNRGEALSHLGRDAEALACFERGSVTAADPSTALLNQGKALQKLGKPTEALERLDQALVLDPQLDEAVLARGDVLIGEGRHEEALACFDQILGMFPHDLEAINGRAIALGKMHNLPAALLCLEEALERHPGHFRTLINLGIALDGLVRYEEALASFDEALAARPGNLEVLLDKASTLFRMYRLEDSRACLDRVLERLPDDVDALNTMGAILWQQNSNAAARVYLERAVRLRPSHVNALNNLSFLDLAEGDLVQGFRGQEIRFKTEVFSAYRARSSAPAWLGGESIAGKTIFVQHEQGLGDTLQFVRYARLLKERGAKVIVSAPNTLRELIKTVAGIDVVVGDDEAIPPHDVQCPMMSLPLAFATTLDTIPGGVPYIQADPERIAEWRRRLGPARRPRIGLVWAGRQWHPRNVARDMSLRDLLPLLQLDAEFISLQKDVPVTDQALLESQTQLVRLGESVKDFSDTAALVALLDLIITVDTSVVHLAGALDRPVWLMNRFASCWRWLRDGRTGSPWYPSVQIFRQGTLDDWEGVVRELKEAAEDFVTGWAPANPSEVPEVPEGQESPASSATVLRRAALLAREGHHAAAIQSYSEVLAAEPGNAAVLSSLGLVLGQAGLHEQALAYFDEALLNSGESSELLCNRGAALMALGNPAQALPCFDRALELDAANLPAYFNRAVALLRQGRRRQALASFDEVLSKDPQNPECRHLRSQILLALGNYRDGFRELESRWQTAAMRGRALATTAPLWLGQTALDGKTILVYQEQGLAEGLQMLRYVPELAGLAGRVLLGFPRELHSLLSVSFAGLPNVEVLPPARELPAHDAHCPVMSLPLAFKTQLETLPAQVSYLRAGTEHVEKCRGRLGSSARLRVGLAWRETGVAGGGEGMDLSDLLPLLEIPADYYSLQLEPLEAEQALTGRLCRHEEPLHEAASMAAFIECLDLVISTDTAAAHLAGALGKPVWVLLSHTPHWRWLEERTDSPWYPRARLFRLEEQAPWSAAVRQVAAALRALLPPASSAAAARPSPTPAGAAPNHGQPGDSRSHPAHGAAHGADAVQAQFDKGTALYAQQDFAAAAECFEALLAQAPGRLDALGASGQALLRLGRPLEALQRFDRLLRQAPAHPEALHHRGLALIDLQRLPEALACFERLLSQHPEHFLALSAHAVVLNRLSRHPEALASCDRALRADPRSVIARVTRATALERLDRPKEALTCLDEALALEPNNFVALVSRGVVLQQLDRLEEALVCIEAALAQCPEHPDAVYNRSFIHLARGRLPEGFRDQESRWHTSLAGKGELPLGSPKWLGREALDGRRILIYAEQGYGDTLQFCRYVPMLAARGARVLLCAPPALTSLLRTLPCPVELLAADDPLPPHDLHCPLLSLPHAFGTTLQSIPAGIPYLSADAERSARWQERLGPKTGVRLGLVWAGRQGGRGPHARDIPLSLMKPLLDLQAEVISLQKDVPESDRAQLASFPRLANHGEALNDFADCAALIDNLDLVISADTAVAHLAGALGKDVWVLNRFSPCWRWLRDRDDSPWYPKARLFRQRSFGDWEGVIHEARQHAVAFIARSNARGRGR